MMRRFGLVLGSWVLLTGCGGAQSASGTHAAPGKGADPGSKGAKERAKLPAASRVGSPKLADRRAASALASDGLGVVRGQSQRPPQTSAEVYRAVAPAVVIIRVPGGMGSGVIIDPSGFILTNNHVVESGDREDFRVKVSVILGKIDPATGSMEREEKEYPALVYKTDKLRDLALVKLVDPPAKLPFVPLAQDNPVPGQRVLAIGHAGAGMLWAIKPGEISALGKLRDHLATLAQFKDDPEGKAAAEQFRKYLDDQNLGLVIQSTAPILPGDSGGPLVSTTGEIVGLNAFSNRDPRTGGLLNFHVHRAEIETFLKERPAKAAQQVPDPWKEGGADASFDDADLDGSVDVLLMQGRAACFYCPRLSGAVFVDLDQSSYASGASVPPLTEVFEKKAFDAELIYLENEGKAYVWYDTDNDGNFDTLLHDPSISGESSAAYRIGKDGELTRDDSVANGRDVRMSLFRDAGLRARLQSVASAAFLDRNVEVSGGKQSSLPTPMAGGGHAGTQDLDEDGRADTVRVQGPFSVRVMVDVDQSSVPQLPSSFDFGKEVRSEQLDAELAVISQGNHMWSWWDTNDDGRFDLVLHAAGARSYVATEAFAVDGAGNRVPAPEHVGRKLIRAELLPAGTLAQRLSISVEKNFLSILATKSDAGVASFPEPVKDSRGSSFDLVVYKAAPKAIVSISGYGSEGYLMDLEESSLRKVDPKKTSVQSVVESGKFNAQFAFYQREGLAWTYYDTDGKGGFDVVLYTGDPWSGRASSGFRVDAAGKVSLDTSLAGAPMVRPSLFTKKPLGKKLSKIAHDVFGERMQEQP